MLENFEDDRDDLIQQCRDAERNVHQNVKNLKKSDEAAVRNRNIERNTVSVNHST